MRTREEQEAINQACKFHPETKEELQELVDDPKVYLGDIDTSEITNMVYLFYCSKREDFSGIEKWDISKVTDMSGMFLQCTAFNQPLDNWDVSSVKNMNSMFYGCENFNQDISSWDVANVKDMCWMFAWCKKFNQSLNAWSVREDCDCSYAFCGSNLSLENVNEAFTKEQFLYCGSVKIIEALNNEKEQVEVQKVTVKQGRGR